MEKIIRVGMMPGRIEEYAVEVGTPISEVLAMAGLDPTGYDVKVDGIKITELSQNHVNESTNLILLAKQVKGNSDKTVRVGMMPGRIEEYAVEVDSTVAEVLQLANLDTTGYDVKVDGIKITDFDTPVTQSTNLILLVKQVKGN